jgi:hypothetical protein
MREAELRVLHVASLRDRHALETLSHAVKVVERLGVGQLLIALDDRHADARLPGDLPEEMRTLGCRGLTSAGTVRALQRQLSNVFAQDLYAVHLHGMSACLIGSRALAEMPLRSRVVYSPHLTYAGSPLTISLLGRFWRSRLDALQGAAVTASPVEAHTLSKLLNRSADVLPHLVGERYFAATKLEAPRPTVVADGAGQEAVEVVSRLSVLLNGREARVLVSWMGEASPRVRSQLEASGVQLLGVRDDAERARELAQAWAFVHVSTGRALPIAVAQAMAVGVPSLVWDTPAHRALVWHGETGFVCTSERDLLDKLVLLLRDPAERRQIGEAARTEAAGRFTWRHFERALLRAYGFSGKWHQQEGVPALRLERNP